MDWTPTPEAGSTRSSASSWVEVVKDGDPVKGVAVKEEEPESNNTVAIKQSAGADVRSANADEDALATAAD